MTLFRQLFLGVSVLFFVLLAGVEAIYLANSRMQLQEQLVSQAQDAATSLALRLATLGNLEDAVLIETPIIGDPVNRAAKLQNQTKVEGVLGLASLACRDRAFEQGYVPDGPQPVLADRAVAGVSGLVSLVVLGAPVEPEKRSRSGPFRA